MTSKNQQKENLQSLDLADNKSTHLNDEEAR